jgi:hypothetical protein
MILFVMILFVMILVTSANELDVLPLVICESIDTLLQNQIYNYNSDFLKLYKPIQEQLIELQKMCNHCYRNRQHVLDDYHSR